ncbi:MAG: hypothetical protein M9894_28065 [Planctomycetes bacterium]|nr:hypothetical protein [Planctomycetota bacterium]
MARAAVSGPEEQVFHFGQWKTKDWADQLDWAQEATHYRHRRRKVARIPYGQETFREPVEASRGPCRHCGTIAGKLHDPGCDYEECPVCRGQVMSCDCDPGIVAPRPEPG